MTKAGVARFYGKVERSPYSPFEILLDGRPLKTPGGATLTTGRARALADAIADEWRAQDGIIRPETMPLTKMMNTAIDGISVNRAAVIDDVANYANSDLLCYRAEAPADLVRRQSAAWDKWLAWTVERYWAKLEVVAGVTHTPQSADALERLKEAVSARDDMSLMALHVAVTTTGSLVLGLALAERAMTAREAFDASQVDENFQAERWGRDAEAEAVRARRLNELEVAERLLHLIAA